MSSSQFYHEIVDEGKALISQHEYQSRENNLIFEV